MEKYPDKLTHITALLNTNPNTSIAGFISRVYFPNTSHGWHQTVSLYVGPPKIITDVKKLNEYMLGSIIDLQHDIADNFFMQPCGEFLSLGKLHFDEDIGAMSITHEPHINVDISEPPDFPVTSQGIHKIIQKIRRRTWVHFFPSYTIAKEIFSRDTETSYTSCLHMEYVLTHAKCEQAEQIRVDSLSRRPFLAHLISPECRTREKKKKET